MVRADGASLRDHLEIVEQQTGKTPDRLLVEAIPVEYSWHWQTWVSLHSGRTYGSMGAVPLTWLDIDAWSRMMGVRLTQLDLLIVRIIDSVWFSTQANERERQEKARARDSAKETTVRGNRRS